jgi:cell division protease FtsH
VPARLIRRLTALTAILVAAVLLAPTAALADQNATPRPPSPAASPLTTPRKPSMLEILIWPGVVLTGIAVFAFVAMRRPRAERPGGMSGQAAHASAYTKVRSGVAVTTPSTSFRDVAGCEEAIEELEEVVAFLDRPEVFARVKARMPRGVILHGPPGTGKTLLARAVAGEAGVAFFAASGSDFVELYVGTGAARVRDLFARARREEAGAVVFIDEIDAIGRRRSDGRFAGSDEREVTLNQLLVELDGFEKLDNVVVIAATNRLDVLDPALLRPGRFDRQISIDPPGERGRLAILRIHAAGMPLENPADLEALARVTGGSSGSQLALIVNEAAIVAARDGRATITADDLGEGHLRALMGPRKRELVHGPNEREAVAWHEAGHALAAELLEDHAKPQVVTARPRGRAAGLALFGQSDQALMAPKHLRARLIVAMAGRASELLHDGSISSGAAQDLEAANDLARTAVERLGFSELVGSLVSSARDHMPFAEETRARIDGEVGRLVREAQDAALELLTPYRPTLDRLAVALLEHDQLDRAHFLRIVGPVETSEPAVARDAAGRA